MKLKMKSHRLVYASLLSLVFSVSAGISAANAGQQIAAGKEAKQVEAEPRFKIYGWVEGGITWNPDRPKDHQNFGHLFTDRSNEPLLNQATIVLERVLKPEPGQYDWGFRLQGMFGSDSRFTHYFGELDNTMMRSCSPTLLKLMCSCTRHGSRKAVSISSSGSSLPLKGSK